uniref:Uncharacterized protein LOC114346804 n=1 Tax=Diabrotica virgifera virgifera TaxID=50390 RepID=A0A6P7HC38_DIAVI
MNQDSTNNESLVETLKSLKCTYCGNILSIGPIMILSISRHEYQCGRCKEITRKGPPVRALLYESVAKHLLFPCIYPNCHEKLSWAFVKIHEENCPHKTICCPISQCFEKLEENDIIAHMKQKHPADICFDNIIFKFTIDDDCSFIAVINSLIFLIYFRNSELFVSLISKSNKSFTYTAKLRNMKENTPYIYFKGSVIDRFDENRFCSNCREYKLSIEKKIRARRYFIEDKVEEKIVSNETVQQVAAAEVKKILLPIYNKLNSADCIQLVIEIQDREEELLLAESKNANSDTIRKILECVVCMEDMVSYIYMCKGGHDVCANCIKTLQGCPFCRKPIENQRNFALEYIAENFIISCKYNTNGCTFLGNLKSLAVHENKCTLQSLDHTF